MDESCAEERKTFWQSLLLYMDAGLTFFNDLSVQNRTNRSGLECAADLDDANMLLDEYSAYTTCNHPDYL